MSFYQAHWYINPIWFWLDILTDNPCIENGMLDLAYFTEVDPMWADSKKTFLINPDAALFANLPAQLACPFDCALATAGFPQKRSSGVRGAKDRCTPLMVGMNGMWAALPRRRCWHRE